MALEGSSVDSTVYTSSAEKLVSLRQSNSVSLFECKVNCVGVIEVEEGRMGAFIK